MIASANKSATVNTSILSNFFSSGSFIVSNTINLVIEDSFILSIAGPDKTACVQQAYISLAPNFFNALAAFVIVPAVSIISSSIMIFLPSTSPIRFITSETLAFGLLLSIIASGTSPSNWLANFLDLVTLPKSGETTVKSSNPIWLK